MFTILVIFIAISILLYLLNFLFKKVFAAIMKALQLILIPVTLVFLYLSYRFLSSFLPPIFVELRDELMSWPTSFDALTVHLTTVALPLLRSKLPLIKFPLLFCAFCIGAALMLYLTLCTIRTISVRGAVARESSQQGISQLPTLSASTSMESLKEIMIATLLSQQGNYSPHSTSNAIFDLEQRMKMQMEDLKEELHRLLHNDLATFASTLAMTYPSPTTISEMAQAAVVQHAEIAKEQSTPSTSTTPLNFSDIISTLPPNVNIVMSDEPLEGSFEPDEYGFGENDSEKNDLPEVNTASSFKQTKKATKKRVQFAQKPVPKEVLDRPAAELTEEQMKQILAVKEAERKERERLLEKLTDEEKEMDAGALHRKWKLELQQKQCEQMILNPFDFDELGKLNEEEKQLTKREVRKIIADRKYKRWVESMRAKGVPLRQCEVCKELANDKHVCLATRFSHGKKKVVIKQTNSGALKVDEVQYHDQEMIDKQFKEIEALKKDSDEKNARIQELLKDRRTEDSPMAATVSSGQVAPGTKRV